jgi:hypothetical protein
MSYLFSIEPTWDIKDYQKLDYKLDKHKVDDDNRLYIEAGHLAQSLSLYNYFEPNPMPKSVDYIISKFDKINNLSVAINLFVPGQYLPLHYDRFDNYKKLYSIKNASICRYMVMLEDHASGQMLQIGNTVYHNWQAGAVFGWCNCDLHTFYNLSLKNRYAVQITGSL